MEMPIRKPTVYERDLLRRLCAFPHEGYDIYAKQVDCLLVREIDEEHQLELLVDDKAPRVMPPFSSRWFIGEARYIDADGSPVSFMLHARDGQLRLLEILKGPVPTAVLIRHPVFEQLQFVDPIQ
jgi:hypothetical protein